MACRKFVLCAIVALLLISTCGHCVRWVPGICEGCPDPEGKPPVNRPGYPSAADCRRSEHRWKEKAESLVQSIIANEQPRTCDNRAKNTEVAYKELYRTDGFRGPDLWMTGRLQAAFNIKLPSLARAIFTLWPQMAGKRFRMVCATDRAFTQNVYWVNDRSFEITGDNIQYCLFAVYDWAYTCSGGQAKECWCARLNIHGAGGLIYERADQSWTCLQEFADWVKEAHQWFKDNI